MKREEIENLLRKVTEDKLWNPGITVGEFINDVLDPESEFRSACIDVIRYHFTDLMYDGCDTDDEIDSDEVNLIHDDIMRDYHFGFTGFINNVYVAAQVMRGKLNNVTIVDDAESKYKSGKKAVINTNGSAIVPITTIGYMKNGSMITADIPYYVYNNQIFGYCGCTTIPEGATVPLSAIIHAIIKLLNSDDIDFSNDDMLYVKPHGFASFMTVSYISNDVLHINKNGMTNTEVTLVAHII